jgi:hypothetical protein
VLQARDVPRDYGLWCSPAPTRGSGSSSPTCTLPVFGEAPPPASLIRWRRHGTRRAASILEPLEHALEMGDFFKGLFQ